MWEEASVCREPLKCFAALWNNSAQLWCAIIPHESSVTEVLLELAKCDFRMDFSNNPARHWSEHQRSYFGSWIERARRECTDVEVMDLLQDLKLPAKIKGNQKIDAAVEKLEKILAKREGVTSRREVCTMECKRRNERKLPRSRSVSCKRLGTPTSEIEVSTSTRGRKRGAQSSSQNTLNCPTDIEAENKRLAKKAPLMCPPSPVLGPTEKNTAEPQKAACGSAVALRDVTCAQPKRPAQATTMKTPVGSMHYNKGKAGTDRDPRANGMWVWIVITMGKGATRYTHANGLKRITYSVLPRKKVLHRVVLVVR